MYSGSESVTYLGKAPYVNNYRNPLQKYVKDNLLMILFHITIMINSNLPPPSSASSSSPPPPPTPRPTLMGCWRCSHGHGQKESFLFSIFFVVGATIRTHQEIQCLLYAAFLLFVLFIRPSVAGADLQTAMPVKQSVTHSVTNPLLSTP